MKHTRMIAVLALAMPLLAQTESRPSAPVVKTEKLWKIDTTGLSG